MSKLRDDVIEFWKSKGEHAVIANVAVPTDYLLRYQELTAREILSEKNSEVRRVLLSLKGGKTSIGEYLMREGEYKIIFPEDEWGELGEVMIEGEPENYFRCINITPDSTGTIPFEDLLPKTRAKIIQSTETHNANIDRYLSKDVNMVRIFGRPKKDTPKEWLKYSEKKLGKKVKDVTKLKFKEYILPVPPGTYKTNKDVSARLFGLKADEYNPDREA